MSDFWGVGGVHGSETNKQTSSIRRVCLAHDYHLRNLYTSMRRLERYFHQEGND